jgi:hypothetical protein
VSHRTVWCASGATTTSRATVYCNRIQCAKVRARVRARAVGAPDSLQDLSGAPPDSPEAPQVRAPRPTLAYSTLWRPNGRGLQSTPLKRSKDQLEYHGVLLCLSISLLRGISTTWSLSPLHLRFTKKYEVREELATHTRLKIRATTRTQVATRARNKSSMSSQLNKSSRCYHNEPNARDQCLGA